MNQKPKGSNLSASKQGDLIQNQISTSQAGQTFNLSQNFSSTLKEGNHSAQIGTELKKCLDSGISGASIVEKKSKDFEETMSKILQHGIQSDKFMDIAGLQHRFPEELKEIGFPITLLHYHHHCPKNYVLVYQDCYKRSIYVPYEVALKLYYPIAWYLEQNKVFPYEFTDQEESFNIEQVEKNLRILQEKGYFHYGVTCKEVQNSIEIETPTGHDYLTLEGMELQNQKWAETVVNGRKVGGCFYVRGCIPTGNRGHVSSGFHNSF